MEHSRRLALGILRKLNERGYAAYMVGGCVRDKLAGRPTKDIDIATSAEPSQVMELFSRVEPTGLQHGTVTVLCEGVPFEVTTFRAERGYADHRRPSEIEFITDIAGDLARRDFTINAMAEGADGELIDPFGGAADLQRGLLRCVGDADERFGEDALRLLRCVRFAAEYALQIDKATWSALILRRELIRHVAVERVRVELEKTIEGRDPDRGVALLADSGLVCALSVDTGLPLRERWDAAAAAAAHSQGGWLAYGALPGGDERWALLLLRLGAVGGQAEEALRRLTFAKRRAKAIAALVAVHRRMDEQTRSAAAGQRPELLLRLAAVRCGREAALAWLRLLAAGSAAGDPLYARTAFKPLAGGVGAEALAALKAASPGELAIGGAELIRLGYAPGPAIGRTLDKLLELAALQMVGDDQAELIRQAELWLEKEREGG